MAAASGRNAQATVALSPLMSWLAIDEPGDRSAIFAAATIKLASPLRRRPQCLRKRHGKQAVWGLGAHNPT